MPHHLRTGVTRKPGCSTNSTRTSTRKITKPGQTGQALLAGWIRRTTASQSNSTCPQRPEKGQPQASSERSIFNGMAELPTRVMLVPRHRGFDRLRPSEPWDHWSDPKYDLLELSLLNPCLEHRSACQRSLPDLAASGANLSKPLCRGTRPTCQAGPATRRQPGRDSRGPSPSRRHAPTTYASPAAHCPAPCAVPPRSRRR